MLKCFPITTQPPSSQRESDWEGRQLNPGLRHFFGVETSLVRLPNFLLLDTDLEQFHAKTSQQVLIHQPRYDALADKRHCWDVWSWDGSQSMELANLVSSRRYLKCDVPQGRFPQTWNFLGYVYTAAGKHAPSCNVDTPLVRSFLNRRQIVINTMIHRYIVDLCTTSAHTFLTMGTSIPFSSDSFLSPF